MAHPARVEHKRSLYTVSEHVITPYQFTTQVRQNLAQLLQSLVLVRPEG